MESSLFVHKRRIPCDGYTPPMSREDAQKYLQDIPGRALAGDSVDEEFRFGSYLRGFEFAYSLGKVAEKAGHDPDILIG